MNELDIILKEPLAKDAVQEAAYWLNFADEGIVRFVIDPVDRDRVRVWALPSSSADTVEAKVHATLERFTESFSSVESSSEDSVRRIGGSPDNDCSQFDPDTIIEAGLLNQLGFADVEIRGITVVLTRAFDEVFRKIGTRMGGQERAYSTLLPIDFLEHCRYFDAFPQNIMYPAMMHADVDAANRFVTKTLANEGRPPRDFTGFTDRTHVLAPAACFHVYLANANETLLDNTIITTLGRCYRYEGRNARTLERLWDFQMRELVFLGDQTFVEECRRQTQHKVLELVEQWGLSGVVETGHDPFFLRGGHLDCELADEPKFELRLDLPYRHADFACASFNNSGTFFSSTSDIMLANGSPAWTGCSAFGIERWAWAVLAQHGPDPDHWPQSLQKLIKESD
ncbi:hypothetical protein [uncultured Propionibacterium sp.]|uniref:hypothetical protein n=1 Tax=uncultured Propionibacterium sp. TaxID=218066 RepID=UPI00292D2AFE|nr:hypothetical protein [uncultured Propionibacterium sp.]